MRLGRYLLLLLAVLCVSLATAAELVAPRARFFGLTLLIIVYLGYEVYTYTRRRRGALVSPVVLASLWLFLLPFGLTNFLYLLPEARLAAAGIGLPDYAWMNQAMELALLGAVGMWIGYRLRLGRLAGHDLRRVLTSRRVLRHSFDLRWPVVTLCILGAIAARVSLVWLGLFGYSAELERLYELSGITQYLRFGTQLGSVALIAVGLSYYATRGSILGLAFVLLLFHEIVWGFLSGFKSQVIMPVVVAALCRYLVLRTVSRGALVVVPVLLVIAYTVIEPYRHVRYSDRTFESQSLGSITHMLIAVIGGGRGSEILSRELDALSLSIAGRARLTEFAARAIEHKNEVGTAADAPPFLTNLFFAPVHALVPRLLWPEKPTMTAGAWFSRTVVGGTAFTSLAMSPVGYLYYAAGALAVFLGFVLLGLAQRSAFEALFIPWGGAFLVFIGMLSVLVMVDSEFHTFIVDGIRYFPLLLITQSVVFRR